jgi:hypothetical protein
MIITTKHRYVYVELPHTNSTVTKSADYLEYCALETTPRARRVFGACLRRWNHTAYRVLGDPRTVYRRYPRMKA